MVQRALSLFVLWLALTGAAVAQIAVPGPPNPAPGSPEPAMERLIGLRLEPAYIAVEAYYNGSSFSGGGIMRAIGTYRVRVGRQWRTEERNVSHLVLWSSSRPDVFDVLPDWNLFPDGLYVYSQDTGAIGQTTITVRLGSFAADGTIVVWAD